MASYVHVGLALRLKIKIMGELSLVFTGICADIYVTFRFPSEKYKIVSWKKKEFKDIENLLFSFRLYFVIAGVSLCIFTLYHVLFATINMYDIDCKKKVSSFLSFCAFFIFSSRTSLALPLAFSG